MSVNPEDHNTKESDFGFSDSNEAGKGIADHDIEESNIGLPHSNEAGKENAADQEESSEEKNAIDSFFENKEKFNENVLATYDALLEIANEVTDCVFTFTLLKANDTPLYLASVVFLGMSLLLRLVIALRVRNNIQGGRWKRYLFGVLTSLVEPLTGERIINNVQKQAFYDYGGDREGNRTDPFYVWDKKKNDSKSWIYIYRP